MAGFRKAEPQQSAIKLGMYGATGTGKTFTMLLFMEGLAKLTGKRSAIVLTEPGADFYCQHVPERKFHPEAFDFDELPTRSITEASFEIQRLDLTKYGQIAIDSISHLWDATMNAYDGRRTSEGSIPIGAWGKVKKPYRDLFDWCMNSDLHFIICGREGIAMEKDPDTGETEVTGPKMKAEKESAYEPNMMFRMQTRLHAREVVPTVYVEKDRTGILAYQTIAWPTYENCIQPVIHLLKGHQRQIPSIDEASAVDAERLKELEMQRTARSADILRQYKAQYEIAKSAADIAAVNKEITPALKKEMLPADIAELKQAFLEASARFPKEAK